MLGHDDEASKPRIRFGYVGYVLTCFDPVIRGLALVSLIGPRGELVAGLAECHHQSHVG